MSNLAAHISQTRMVDTHEHLHSEQEFVEEGPDLLQDLFDNYISADLLVAGASQDAVRHLLDASDPDLSSRLKGVRDAWQRCRHTGYGEGSLHPRASGLRHRGDCRTHARTTGGGASPQPGAAAAWRAAALAPRRRQP